MAAGRLWKETTNWGMSNPGVCFLLFFLLLFPRQYWTPIQRHVTERVWAGGLSGFFSLFIFSCPPAPKQVPGTKLWCCGTDGSSSQTDIYNFEVNSSLGPDKLDLKSEGSEIPIVLCLYPFLPWPSIAAE